MRSSQSLVSFLSLNALVASILLVVGNRVEARSAISKSEPRAYCFREVGTGRVLAAKNMHSVRSIASLSKMMAALVFMDRGLRLDGVTVLSPVDIKTARGGARTRLRTGAKYRNRDLLYAALLASDNAAVSALGRAVGLSPVQLTEAMNRRARAMGLGHTHFEDPVGIDHGNVSTAWELTAILQAVMRQPILHRVTTTPEHYLRAVWPRRHHVNYLNTNLFLFRRRFRVLAGKTGFNSAAGYCLAAAVTERGWRRPVLGVVLGSRRKLSRFSDFARIAATFSRYAPGRRKAASRVRPRVKVRHAVALGRRGRRSGHAVEGHLRRSVSPSRPHRFVRIRRGAARTRQGWMARLGRRGSHHRMRARRWKRFERHRVTFRSRGRFSRRRVPGRGRRLPSGSTLAEGHSD